MGDLTTLASVKAWPTMTGTADDTLLTRLISAVSTAVQSRISRTIASTSYIDTRNGNGKVVMPFPNTPVTAVTSVLVDGAAIPARSTVTGSGYAFDDVMLYLSGYLFTRGVQNVVLTYTAGFLLTPADLEQAVIEIIAHKYKERDHIGQTSMVLAGQQVNYLRDVPVDALRVVDQYRRVFAA